MTEQSFRNYMIFSHEPQARVQVREVKVLYWRLTCCCRLGSLRFRSAGKIQSWNLVSIQRLFLREGEASHSSAEMFDLNNCKQEQNSLHKDQYIKDGLLFLLQEHLFCLSLHFRRLCCDFHFDPVPQIKDFVILEAPQRLTSLTEQLNDRWLNYSMSEEMRGWRKWILQSLVRPITLRKTTFF